MYPLNFACRNVGGTVKEKYSIEFSFLFHSHSVKYWHSQYQDHTKYRILQYASFGSKCRQRGLFITRSKKKEEKEHSMAFYPQKNYIDRKFPLVGEVNANCSE
jgi:hypothetical protein